MCYFIVTGTLPLVNFFLALERCLIIQLVNGFTKRKKNVLFVANLIGSPGVSLIIYLYDPGHVGHIMWWFKMAVGFLNTFVCIFLMWKIRTKTASVNDSIVRKTALFELCLEFLPNLISFLVYKDLFELGNLAPYTALQIASQCLNSAICGIIYYKSLCGKQRIHPARVILPWLAQVQVQRRRVPPNISSAPNHSSIRLTNSM
ncbi:hypothetical protein DdX_17140 [Ditylenchus destructor]|uniref:Uncharacterized protein n=1 Tax=Ditylenchus destructor TaxID=166010 RepID=A0AAD4QZF2_9BILA|nr:hypothetical protein DdX_17140 [Ditylenchus destructor]